MSDLKAGDVVVLKSGSPSLTISAISGNNVRCQWFVGKELKQGDFIVTSLKHPEQSSGSLASRLA
jgi:uncharacterized protein YodC (DUF2158 family)